MKTATTQILFLSAVVMTACGRAVATVETPYEIEWIRQVGTEWDDRACGVSADGLGNVYISGYTHGSLGGNSAGNYDAFVSKYDLGGNLLWIRQIGTSSRDGSAAVSADGLGNAYIAGYTEGSLGGPLAGWFDAFVGKYDSEGNLQWVRQFGPSDWEESWGISADQMGNVYVTGYVHYPDVPYYDGFLTKYDPQGNLVWSGDIGTSDWDVSYGVSADGMGNAYISGAAIGLPGSPNPGNIDPFVSKFDSEGHLLWTSGVGTSDEDWSYCVSADGLGNVYISGYTLGSLGGPNAGSGDAFVSKYDPDGSLLWTCQFGGVEFETGFGISVDKLGSVYISGITYGSLGGPNTGTEDVFVAKLTPEPGTILLLGLGGFGLLRNRRFH